MSVKVDPDTASGHLGVCVYVLFKKKERQQEGWKSRRKQTNGNGERQNPLQWRNW